MIFEKLIAMVSVLHVPFSRFAGRPHSTLSLQITRKRLRNRLLFLTLIISALLAVPGSPAAAPAVPDDQEFLRQQERERLLRQRQEQRPDVRLQPHIESPELLPDQETPCFPIDRIELTGEDADQFQWALDSADLAGDGGRDPALHRCLGSRGISQVMSRIQNSIIAAGFVTTRVLAPPQDLTSGTLRLAFIPGRIRAVRLAADSSPRARLGNALPADPGELLNLRDIEQALENFKRVPTADADIRIMPAEDEGARPGDSDLVVSWKQRFPLRLTLSADDSGTRATGRYQGNVTLSWDDVLTINDLFYININHDMTGDSGSKGTQGGTIHYSLPYGYWLLGVTASQSEYRQTVAGANQNYLYSGRSENGSITISRIIFRNAVHKTSLGLGGWLRTSNNFIDDVEIEVQRRRMAGWQAEFSERLFIGKATGDLSLGYRCGTGAMGSLAAPEEQFGEGTSRPKIITAGARLALPFAIGSQQFRYNGEFRGQWNQTPLVVLDRFSIGGRYTVRGFDGETTLLADRGWLVRNDMSWLLGESGQELYLGLDHGEVGGESSEQLLGKSLTGAVFGLRGQVQGVCYDLFIGAPLSRPTGFVTAEPTAGFMVSWSF
ncbi:MAG: ShlB/FhaC/HecB family hemolysin secretion/activation protein [Desulfocapsaceae bacterium]|nr:ShlB/FhaC/HecB family hemolysin secretion/activation protein [Desulfocapsaceae bacterium]